MSANFQVMCTCKNCGNQIPLYFEKGKKIDWPKVTRVCPRCDTDAGWEIIK